MFMQGEGEQCCTSIRIPFLPHAYPGPPTFSSPFIQTPPSQLSPVNHFNRISGNAIPGQTPPNPRDYALPDLGEPHSLVFMQHVDTYVALAFGFGNAKVKCTYK